MSDRAGTPALPEDLVDLTELISAYYDLVPDPSVSAERVAFGTSGHRGSSLKKSFNEAHIAATTQAIVDYRRAQGITGPLFLGKDTHPLSEPAHNTALEVLIGNEAGVLKNSRNDYTPTPALSLAIVSYNRERSAAEGLADGIVVTPSHNPLKTAASNTIPRTAARRAPKPPHGSRPGRMSSWNPGCRGSAGSRSPRLSGRPEALTSSASMSRPCRRSWTWTPSAPPEYAWESTLWAGHP